MLIAAALLVAVVWAYWSTGAQLVFIWSNEPQYSHGYLVPLFAVALLWLRRQRLLGAALRPSGWALPVAAGAAVLRLVGARYDFAWLDRMSLLPALAAVCLAAGGRPALRWAWPAVAFLFFMMPLPGRLEGLLGLSLQRIAATMSTHALQTCGFPAQAHGTVILLNQEDLGIEEACSGIRMLLVFFALSTGVAILIERPWYHRAALLASAAPIAVACNVIRIIVTGILYETTGSQVAQFVFHDLAGWLMIPMALGFLGLELWFLSRLLLAQEPDLMEG